MLRSQQDVIAAIAIIIIVTIIIMVIIVTTIETITIIKGKRQIFPTS